jgi:TetR/AcrR family transcriptional regulator, cholesterol catabolism regulator
MVKNRGIQQSSIDPKHAKRLNAIAKVSARLFSSKGYVETSMDDIAAAAKVTKGGVYHYFGSKTDILYHISATYVDLDRAGLEQSLGEIPDVSEKIRFIVFHHIDHYVSHPAAAKTLLHEAYILPPKLLKEVRAKERRYFEIVSATIADFLGTKYTKELATTLTFTLFGMMNWIYNWYDPKGTMKPTELSELIYNTFIQGVRNSILK